VFWGKRFGFVLLAWLQKLLFCFVVCVVASDASARAVNNAQDLQRLDTELRTIMATGQTPALALGIVHNGSVLLTRTLGVQRAGSDVPIDANTRFRLASLSKSISAGLIGKLVQQGFLQWDSPVNLLVPSFRLQDPNSLYMSVEQLLSQRTGLKHHTLDDEMEAADEIATIRAQLPRAPSVCKIGECYAYQNLTYSYAADVAYAASGQFFDVALKRELFEPLSMHRANYGLEGLSEDDNWARGHEREWRKNVPIEVKPNYYWVGAAAGVNASITDMQQWMLALLEYRPQVLAPETAKYLRTSQINTPGELYGPLWRRTRLRSAGYALGLRTFDYAGNPVWFHAGAVQGYRGMMIGAPTKKAAVIILWNSESNLPAGLIPTILDRWFDQSPHDWMQLASYFPKRAK
jgi:beta-lactamase class C